MGSKNCPDNTQPVPVLLSATTAVVGYCRETLHHTLPQRNFSHFSDCETEILAGASVGHAENHAIVCWLPENRETKIFFSVGSIVAIVSVFHRYFIQWEFNKINGKGVK